LAQTYVVFLVIKDMFAAIQAAFVRRKNRSKMMMDYTPLENIDENTKQKVKKVKKVPKDPRSFCLSICPHQRPSFFSKDTVIYCDTTGFYDIETAGVYRVYTSDDDREDDLEDSVVSLWFYSTPFQYVRVWPAKSTQFGREEDTNELVIVFTNNRGEKTSTVVADNVCDIILATKVRSRPTLVEQGEKKTFQR